MVRREDFVSEVVGRLVKLAPTTPGCSCSRRRRNGVASVADTLVGVACARSLAAAVVVEECPPPLMFPLQAAGWEPTEGAASARSRVVVAGSRRRPRFQFVVEAPVEQMVVVMVLTHLTAKATRMCV